MFVPIRTEENMGKLWSKGFIGSEVKAVSTKVRVS